MTKRPDAVYILAALLALGAHGAVFALSWQKQPAVSFKVQAAPGVEIRLAQIAPALKPKPEPEIQPAPPAPKAAAQKKRTAAPAPVAAPLAPPTPAPEATAPQAASSPEPLASLDNRQPRYPELARKRGQQGNVTLLVKVNAEGAVKSLSVQKGSGYSLLDKAAADAVKKWRFSPARLSGRPVAGSALITIEFRLE